MGRLTAKQRAIVREIVREGRAVLSRESSADYLVAAAYVFDNGLLFAGRSALKEQP